jgi:Zn-dependent protease with chaperone function
VTFPGPTAIIPEAARLLLFVLVPVLLSAHLLRRASPRLLGASHMVSLIGWAFLPASSVAFLVAEFAPQGRSSGGPSQLVGFGVAAAMLAPVAWQSGRALVAVRRLELHGPLLSCARQVRLRGGASVWIVPSEQLMAYACGVVRPQAVVTTGLLGLLDPAERAAVLEHEAAHVQLGHPRLMLFGAAVARAYGFLPPVRRAWAGLRREIEAAADDEAARRVGPDPLLCALARIGLASTTASDGGLPFGDPEHLRYRIDRLQRPHRESALAVNLGVVALTGLFAAVLASCACAFLDSQPLLPGLAACLGTTALVASRPLWRRRPS